MATSDPASNDLRVLVCAPIGRDAALARDALGKAHFSVDICSDVDALCREAALGAAVLLLTQEALSPPSLDRLLDALAGQPSWSDLPLVVLISRGPGTLASTSLVASLAPRASVTLLERPVRITTLVSAVRAAFWARQRQYEVRDLLAARLEAEEAERRARADAEQAVQIRDQFLASVAHDLKNPLAGIKGYAQLLRRQTLRTNGPGSDRLVRGLGQIDHMVTRAIGQIDELLDVARLRASQTLELDTVPTDLVALARTLVQEYQEAASEHEIQLTAASDEILGVWDAARLERVLANLLANAMKYSEPGSMVEVHVGSDERWPAGWATLSVRDHGIGIPSADLPRLFEPFYRASNAVGRKPGTGLGLAGARHIVQQHGGTIDVESTEGVGSTFTIRLPVTPPGRRAGRA